MISTQWQSIRMHPRGNSKPGDMITPPSSPPEPFLRLPGWLTPMLGHLGLHVSIAQRLGTAGAVSTGAIVHCGAAKA